MNRIEILKKTKLFVLDMDGTFYLGEHVLDGALDFGRELCRRNILPHQNHRSCILKNLLKWVASSVAKK